MSSEREARRPLLKVLHTGLLERIVEEAKEVLEQVGLFIENEEGLELLGNGGARIHRRARKAYIPKTLSGLVIGQLANLGSPIIWGGCPSAFDMRFGTTPMGAAHVHSDPNRDVQGCYKSKQ